MSVRPVVVDTSVWIEYFRDRSADLRDGIEGLVQQRRLRHLHVITGELLRGALTASEEKAIQETIAHIPLLPLVDAFWVDVGIFARELARRGYVVPLIDAWIAKAVMHHHCLLWSLDRHFAKMAQAAPLELYTEGA